MVEMGLSAKGAGEYVIGQAMKGWSLEPQGHEDSKSNKRSLFGTQVCGACSIGEARVVAQSVVAARRRRAEDE